ncbi:helix-turn-helix domain-containing protein [Nocardia alba]|uniref:AraC family transcriptional regulator n=1 Tax=Nocardia alba TaxID=225051 RepID=A0A4R1FHW4_9NOCA|nr:helix-turn-helix domain-containing protein [Nocardia alba]TCJ94376.1 AraC family transcriptional regulator [Nocardia alba]
MTAFEGFPEICSTARIAAPDAFGYWEQLVAGAITEVSIAPTVSRPFEGRIRSADFGDISVGTVVAEGHELRRTRRHIAKADEFHVIGSVVLAGHAEVEHAGNRVELAPGAMIFYDTSQPIRWCSQGLIEDLTVRVPRQRVVDYLGIRADALPAGMVIRDGGVGPMLARFFRQVAQLHSTDPASAAVLASSGIDLLGAAAAIASGERPGRAQIEAVNGQQVLDYLRANFTDPGLTIERIADGCRVSRRTLYRVVAEFEGGLGAVLREMRLERARVLLVASDFRSIAAVATASGFATERQFYRAFHVATGMTPGEYRVIARSGSPVS